ncbi:hypothetical protein ACP275_10G104400 [Erythranthe tilingii]
MDKAREENLFSDIIFAVVGQGANALNIQLGIAQSMGMTLENMVLPNARANTISTTLSKAQKKTLVILDDIWEDISLEDLGVSNKNVCQVILISRDSTILDGADEVYKLYTVYETEALDFFMKRVGKCIDDEALVNDVVSECNGLPLALAVVARTLKGNTHKDNWRGALRQLKTSNPVDIPKVLAEVYNSIKLSYDFLENEHARDIFLLCSLYPENYSIPVEDLVSYCIGLGTFEHLDELRETRERTSLVLTMLQHRSLLLECHYENYVAMHDIVRDVAIYIASKEGRVDCNIGTTSWLRENSSTNCTWISSFLAKRVQPPRRLEFPNLRLLFSREIGEKKIEMDESFFEGMSMLNVVSITSTSLRSLPQSMQMLKHLRTLVLFDCKSLKTMSIVGELSNLEILRCQLCPSIEEFSIEKGGLRCLKLLEFTSCEKLKRINSGLISGLVELEELNIVKSFDEWGVEDDNGKERNNASLDELQFLSNLTSLQIDVRSCNLAGQDFNLPRNIVSYDIRIGSIRRDAESDELGRKMHLDLSSDAPLGNWVHSFLRNTETLNLQGEFANNLDLSELEKVKWLQVKMCSRMKTLVQIAQPTDWSSGVLPTLEVLILIKLPNFEGICEGAIPEWSQSFRKLREIRLQNLPQLKHLWKQNQNVSLCNIAIIGVLKCRSLRNLGSLQMYGHLRLSEVDIVNCIEMEEVLVNTEHDGTSRHIAFPALEDLTLRKMPKLTTFCRGVEGIEFPVLKSFETGYCKEMTSFVSSTLDHDHDEDSLHLFCKAEVSFGSVTQLRILGHNDHRKIWCQHQISFDFFRGLEVIQIDGFINIESLFSPSIAANLIKLEQLEIYNCSKAVNVIEGKDEVLETCLFPKLRFITLHGLYALKCFWECTYDVELPSLEVVIIGGCTLLENFTLGPISTPKLISFNFADQEDKLDLNALVKQLYDGCSMSMEERIASAQRHEGEEMDAEGQWSEGSGDTDEILDESSENDGREKDEEQDPNKHGEEEGEEKDPNNQGEKEN